MIYFDFIFSLLTNFNGFCLSHIAHLNKLSDKIDLLENSKIEKISKISDYFNQISSEHINSGFNKDINIDSITYAESNDINFEDEKLDKRIHHDNIKNNKKNDPSTMGGLEILVLELIQNNISIWRANLELTLYSGLKIENIISTPISILLTALLNILFNCHIFLFFM